MSSREEKKRVCVYIDGFNLYHAIDAQQDDSLKWLDIDGLGRSFLRPNEELHKCYFFTAILKWNLAKQQRHETYLIALRATGVTVREANFKSSSKYCNGYDRYCDFYEEKQSDVALATTMIADAFDGVPHRSILVTADTDHVPTIELLKQRFPQLDLALRAPPFRQSPWQFCQPAGLVFQSHDP